MKGRGAARAPIALLVVVLLLQGSLGGCARPRDEVHWTIVETARFEIISSLREGEARSLAQSLERFDALVRRVTGLTPAGPIVRTRVVAIARPTQLPQLRRFASDGLLSVGMRSSVIVSFAPASRPGAVAERILHQYVHLLLRDGSMRPHPSWYEEGLATLLSGATVRRDRVVVGALPWSRATAVRSRSGRSVEKLIDLDFEDRLTPVERGVFQVQAWALVRHLMLDRVAKGASSGNELSRYLDLLDLGVAPDEAFPMAFGLSTEAAELGIVRALDDGRMDAIEVSIDSLALAGGASSVRPAEGGEVHVALGEILLVSDDPVGAEHEFRAAIARDERDVRAHARLGEALRRQTRFEEAEAALRRAVSIAPDDPSGHLELGAYHDALARRADSREAMTRELARAREFFERALSIDQTDPESRARLGISYLFPGEDPEQALDHLGRAYARHPASVEIAVALAEARLLRGDAFGARDLLRRVQPTCGDPTIEAPVEASIPAIRARRSMMARQIGLASSSPAIGD